MIKQVKGNLFDLYKNPGIIAHGCNAQGAMGSGFALQIKKRFPEAYSKYMYAYKDGLLHLGSVHFMKYQEELKQPLIIANCITQKYYGFDKTKVYIDYDALTKALLTVADEAKFYNLPISMPVIGGGLANGDLETLFDIYESVLFDTDTTIYTLYNG